MWTLNEIFIEISIEFNFYFILLRTSFYKETIGIIIIRRNEIRVQNTFLIWLADYKNMFGSFKFHKRNQTLNACLRVY